MVDWEPHQELDRRILHGLICEWKNAVGFLSPTLRNRLALPGFELRDFEKRWAEWNRERRIMVFSRKLVMNHRWMSVREVLLHELAHQVTDEVIGGTDQPHGARFQEACRLVNADPRAAGDFPSLYETLNTGELDDNDRILLRVKKLLALSQSANKHEAEVAMTKVHETIARYNIDLLSSPAGNRQYCSLCLGEPQLRQAADEYALSRLLQDFYFVEAVWICAYVFDRARMGRILEISGTAENVKMAGYVYDFLKRTITHQWQVFRKGRAVTSGGKVDFALGLLSGFSEKLKTQDRAMEKDSPATYALMKRDDAGLTTYLRARHPRLRKTSGSGRNIDEQTHRAGQTVGRNTILSKPIEHGTTRRRFLLG
ncbi:MAG: DUF2786 domain-containing protein [bacterium]